MSLRAAIVFYRRQPPPDRGRTPVLFESGDDRHTPATNFELPLPRITRSDVRADVHGGAPRVK